MPLERIIIRSFRSIKEDDVLLTAYTFFIGRNNVGKSNYLKAIDILLSWDKTYKNFDQMANDKNSPIEIIGYFKGCEMFLPLLKESKHQKAAMHIFLNDGHHESEIPEKGHGLQRTAFFAMLRLLAKKASGASSKPTPIFLIEEVEAYLHPTAQAKLVSSILLLTKKYQMFVSTHSPFVISVDSCHGLRLVIRNEKGSQVLGPQKQKDEFDKKDYESIKNNLKYSRHLTALFADKIIIIEGKNDDGFYPKAHALLGFATDGKLIEFLPALSGGVTNVRVAYKFFSLLGLQKIGAILDLDVLFKNDTKHFLKGLNLDESSVDKFRRLIGWTQTGDPSLNDVLAGVKANTAIAPEIEKICAELKKYGVLVLRQGSPENYYSDSLKAKLERASVNEKRLWEHLESKDDLLHADELNTVFQN